MLRSLLVRLVVVFCLAAAYPVTVDASPILVVDTNGLLTGATGVMVDGHRYDVEFVEGTCAEVFGVCDAAHFTFTTQSGAVAASQALLDQVLLDGFGSANAFDTYPALTYGCIFEFNCYIFTPYGTSGMGPSSDGTIANGFLLAAQALNFMLPFGASGGTDAAGVACTNCFPLDPSLQDTLYYSSTHDINGTFARWTGGVAVPEPSSLLLFGAGGVGLIARLRRRKQQRSALTFGRV